MCRTDVRKANLYSDAIEWPAHPGGGEQGMRRGPGVGWAYVTGVRIGETCLLDSFRRAAGFLIEFDEYAEAGTICRFPGRSTTSSRGDSQ